MLLSMAGRAHRSRARRRSDTGVPARWTCTATTCSPFSSVLPLRIKDAKAWAPEVHGSHDQVNGPLAHDGLELWYGTPDAPAPEGTTEQRQGVSVTVGVRPANPSNAVRVRYRVDGRGVETVSAPLVVNDFQKRTQYFRAAFPTFWRARRSSTCRWCRVRGVARRIRQRPPPSRRRSGSATRRPCSPPPRSPRPASGVSRSGSSTWPTPGSSLRASRNSSARHRPALLSAGLP